MKLLTKFRSDKRAVLWVWTVIIVGLFVYSLMWFTTGWAVMEVADNVEAEYTFTGPAAFASTFIKTMFQWHPVLFLFGLILWGYVNSQRKAQLQ